MPCWQNTHEAHQRQAATEELKRFRVSIHAHALVMATATQALCHPTWNSPILLPNCCRSPTYGSTTSMHDCMMPRGPADSTSLSRSSPLISTYTPLFTSPSTFCSGTSHFSKTSSQVSLPRMPSLSSFCADLKPYKQRQQAQWLLWPCLSNSPCSS